MGIVEKEREGRMQHDPDGLCGRPERHGLQLPPAEPGPGGAGGPAGRGRGGPPLGEWGHGPPAEEQSRLCVDESFLEKAGPGEPCFVEDRSVAPFAGRVERVVLYRWGRAYPADLYWDLSLEGWTLARREEFPGFSHEIITKEVYIP